MNKYSTYIFDLDGTITDTMSVWVSVCRDGLRKFGFTPPDDATLVNHTHDFNEMVLFGLAKTQVPSFTKYAYKLANERLANAPFHTGAFEMLTSLKKNGKRLGVFSGMGCVSFEPAMQRYNLYSLVEVAISGSDVRHRKPHPAGIRKALRKLGIEKKDYASAVYVGDKDTDIQAAHNAGVDSILFFPEAHSVVYDLAEMKKHNPTHVITHWRELV